MDTIIIMKHSNSVLSNNFKSSEDNFDCSCTNNECRITLINAELIDVLQRMRDDLKFPITLNSGYRCQRHNKDINGEINSMHIAGAAADIRAYDNSESKLDDIKHWIAKNVINKYGVGLYKTFVHIDVRNIQARWAG